MVISPKFSFKLSVQMVRFSSAQRCLLETELTCSKARNNYGFEFGWQKFDWPITLGQFLISQSLLAIFWVAILNCRENF